MVKTRLFHKLCSTIFYRRYTSTTTSMKRICIVGSGPAGFYTAQNLLKSKLCQVDIYDKLPAPYGLIRYGVAPDHTEIKSVITGFSSVAEYKDCNFYGNINVGKDVSVAELMSAYHAIVFAYGADSGKKLEIPGEESKNIFSSTQFVAWYNGHPDYVNLDVNLDSDVAVVVGHGNVALDIARILLLDIDVLMKTDISEHALEILKKSRVKKVILAGRRGPLQVSFAIKEFREMTNMTNCFSIIHSDDLTGLEEIITSLERPRKRLTDLICTTAKREPKEELEKWWELKFFRYPKAFLPNSQGRVEKVVFGINKQKNLDILKPPEIFDTGKEEIVNSGLVVESIGYQSSSIDPSVPFDNKKRIIPNNRGRVLNLTGDCLKGLYCSGWIKTGPQGVLLPTMYSSYETAGLILQDIANGKLSTNPSLEKEEILNLMKSRGVKYVTFDEWKKINQEEEERGRAKGKPREKICDIREMLRIAQAS